MAPGLRVLFCGFNPGTRSGAIGHNYAGRGNQFWRLLADSGLTPRLLAPEEDRTMLQYGLGSTNLVGRATPSAADLSRAELRAGVGPLRALVETNRPRIVAYTGKGVYLAAAGLGQAAWGEQPVGLFDGVVDFVVPSPSGLARLPYAEKLRWFAALAGRAG
ncbi:mismatch-specific DNA-glycosylase [Azospirillum sp. TSO22-1]|uniref:mismatch-specific DNA-glycosylase n=1 Tax=Azospirillum sp. TSO22-1 TaxID=716789 RepID=UPI001FFFBD2F|nr:mismatch-specific DNA-glycosylase [Azospirillum sp. TSO22-1]